MVVHFLQGQTVQVHWQSTSHFCWTASGLEGEGATIILLTSREGALPQPASVSTFMPLRHYNKQHYLPFFLFYVSKRRKYEHTVTIQQSTFLPVLFPVNKSC